MRMKLKLDPRTEDYFDLMEAESYILGESKRIVENAISLLRTYESSSRKNPVLLTKALNELKGEYELCETNKPDEKRKAAAIAWIIIRTTFHHKRDECVEWIKKASELGLGNARYLMLNPPECLSPYISIN